jgi:hypothetical protein
MLIDVDHVGAKPKVSGEVVVVLSKDPIVYHDASGEEIRGLMRGDVDPKVDFNDFLVLVKAFGTNAAGSEFDWRADLNADDRVDFADFLIFSSDFGKVAVDAPSALRATRPALPAGANTDAEVLLNVDGKARMDQELVLTVDVSQASAVQGWGLSVRFDPDRYEFVEAKAPEANLLEAEGGTAPLFLVHQEGADQVTLSSAVNAGQAPSGDGTLAVLIFRPKGEVEEARFEVFEGVLFDPTHLANPVVPSESLVKLVPAEFALHQNYPNPFNPETTIMYDLAEGSRVRLEVYNVLGQLVHTLVNEEQPAGRYRMHWAGRDAQGRQVASGIYFYRLQTQTFGGVRKLMLLK